MGKFNPEKLEKIGEGAEKEVYLHPDDPNKVIAEWFPERAAKESPRQVKGRYYLTKIMHLLFPKNIPDIHLIYKNKRQVAVLERKEADSEHRELHEVILALRKKQTDELSKKFWKKLSMHERKIGADERFRDFIAEIGKFNVEIDSTKFNFGHDKDGNLLYLDNSFRPWYESGTAQHKSIVRYNEDELIKAINALSDVDREKASLYLKRLEELRKEELDERKSKQK